MALTVSQVAKLAGVSVRTLHHYDEVGLLRPSDRSEAGYRLYSHADLQRLQQVLFFKELGFSLEEILRILNDPGFDLGEALRMQRTLLLERKERVQSLITAVEKTLAALEKGTVMTKEEMFEVWESEANQRWGDSEAYRESKRRTARYGKAEWQAIKAEGDQITQAFVALLDRGAKPDGDEACALAERHRAYISKWFYACSPQIHRGLGELYIADERFTANIDQARPGLAQFMSEAFRANAERLGA